MNTVKPPAILEWPHRLIDVRNPDEYAAERLARAAECVPLGILAEAAAAWEHDRPLLILCKSGGRARQAAEQLEALGFADVHLVEGGLEACKRAGVGITAGAGPMPMFRQVLVAASILLLIGLGLSFVHPLFLLLDLMVACGMLFAGLTGVCFMARLLAVMPWNAPRKSCPTGSCALRA